MRNFDPYAGHSWASGHAKFGDGNNNESSSEAMNAWYGMILWGEFTGDTAVRDRGIYLYTTEMQAIQEYWFDVHDENHPATFTPSVVTMVWGGKGANATWFTANPEAVHGITKEIEVAGALLTSGKPFLYPEIVFLLDAMRQITMACPKVEPPRARSAPVAVPRSGPGRAKTARA